MTDINALVTDHIEIWTSAIKTQSTSGRGNRKKLELTGIKKLRELILELAVRGKLVPQDPDDEPASVLLEKISIEKERLYQEKKIKKQKKLYDIRDEEILFILPQGWTWSRLGDLTNYGSVDKAESNNVELDTWVLELEDVEKETSKLLKKVRFKDREFKSSKNRFNLGDVIYGKLRPYLDKVIVADEPGVCTTEMIPFHSYNGVESKFLRLLMKSPFFITVANASTHGMNLPRLGTDKARIALLPIAPQNEQHRIVTKVDELMALCDQLEQQSEESITTHQTLVDTLLDALVNPEQEATAFADSWTLIEQHFDTLFTTEQSIDKLKQTILQLAVMGKLVPQDPNDEPASVLLEKIAAEKEQLVKEKKIKKPKKHIDISEDEKLFELPLGWTYIRFGDLTQDVATGPFGSMIHKSDYVKSGVPLINPSHMVNGKVIEDMNISVTEDKAQELSSYSLSIGDIIMARRGEMGRCALITERESSWICGTGSFILSFFHEIPREFILLLFKTPWVRDYLGGESIGTTMTNLNHGILKKLPVLIPPLSEQHRIVAKVDKLMNFCNKLKIQLERKKVIQQHLTDAFVEKTLSKESL